uniref:G_PROTEIN_RECEP_F1_2 domain-containing protein n=1 Tax=Meloidogyne hapla TaxID=6305 RepID=A0A1I8BBD7_MELHA
MQFTSLLVMKEYGKKESKKLQIVDDNTHKERIRILFVCLISVFPCPLYIGMFKLSVILNNYFRETTEFIIITAIFNTSLNLIQCIEEICLFIISKDFRKLVKNQFFKNKQINVVGTAIMVTQNPQQAKIFK